MSERDEVKIVRVLGVVDIGKNGGKWYGRIRYELVDGAEVVSMYGPSSTKKHIVEQGTPREVGNMSAYYHDGRFAGITTRYSTAFAQGGRGLAPVTA